MRQLNLDEIELVSGGVGPVGALVGAGTGAIYGGGAYLIGHVYADGGQGITIAGFGISVFGGAVTGGIAGFSAGLLSGVAVGAGSVVTAGAAGWADNHYGTGTSTQNYYNPSYSHNAHPSTNGYSSNWNGVVFGAGAPSEPGGGYSHLQRHTH